jgi:anti-sigma-K factor RskA
MSTNPFDMDDLLGAYALDAVDEYERRAVEEYLAVSPRARAEVQEHREVATMLAWSGMDAPEGLWERIAGSLEGQEAEPASELGHVISISAGRRGKLARTIGSWAIATAAAALIAIVAVRVSNDDDVSSPTGIDEQARAALADESLPHAQLSTEADSNLKVLAVIDEDGRGFLLADSLPAIAPDRTYQLWGRSAGKLISIGLLGPDPGTTVFTVTDDVDLLAISNEPKGGVSTPGDLVIVAGPLA